MTLAAGDKITIGTDYLGGSFAVATPHGHHGDFTVNRQGAKLTNSDTTSTTKAFAEYTTATFNETTTSVFRVHVKGGKAGDVLDVKVNGVSVGSVTLNTDGVGKLVFSTNPKGSAVAFPANFPVITATTTITVQVGETLSGTLARFPVGRIVTANCPR